MKSKEKAPEELHVVQSVSSPIDRRRWLSGSLGAIGSFGAAAALGTELLLDASPAEAADAKLSPVGLWTTYDDDGKTIKGVMELSIDKKGILSGKVVKLIELKDPNAKCTECDGDRKNKPILGMVVVWGLKEDGDEWTGGRALDPANGNVYNCFIEVLEGGKKLKIRGYLGIALLGRTQYWTRRAKL